MDKTQLQEQRSFQQTISGVEDFATFDYVDRPAFSQTICGAEHSAASYVQLTNTRIAGTIK